MKSLLIHESMTWQFFLFLDHIKNLKEKYISTYQLELDEELSELLTSISMKKDMKLHFNIRIVLLLQRRKIK